MVWSSRVPVTPTKVILSQPNSNNKLTASSVSVSSFTIGCFTILTSDFSTSRSMSCLIESKSPIR